MAGTRASWRRWRWTSALDGGQAWRPGRDGGTQRYANRGGKHKECYAELARSGDLVVKHTDPWKGIIIRKRKAKAKDSEFDAFLSIEKRDDDHRIPISILGTVDNPSLKVEVMELGKALQTDLNRQKEELKKIFKKEAEKKSGTGLQFEWEEDDDI